METLPTFPLINCANVSNIPSSLAPNKLLSFGIAKIHTLELQKS